MPTPDRNLVHALAVREFARLPPELVVELLDEYGRQPWHIERDRIHLGILKLANGDEDDLLDWITVACRDSRDVLAAAEFPLQSRYHPQRWATAPAEERTTVLNLDRSQYDVWLQKPTPIQVVREP
jgi:hypothetical protein